MQYRFTIQIAIRCDFNGFQRVVRVCEEQSIQDPLCSERYSAANSGEQYQSADGEEDFLSALRRGFFGADFDIEQMLMFSLPGRRSSLILFAY